MADLPVLVLLGLPLQDPALEDAVLEHLEGHLDVLLGHDLNGRLAGQFPQERAVPAVQPFHVVRVDRVLHDLHEVAGQFGVGDVPPHVGPDEQVVARQQRGRRRAEVGEDQPAQLRDRVGRRPDPAGKRAVRQFSWLLQTASVRAEQPAVVPAAQARLFGTAEGEGGTAVRALLGQQPELAASVPEQDQVLAEQPPPRRYPACHVVGGHRPPVPAQQVPHRGSWPDRGEALVFLLAEHGRLPVVALACGLCKTVLVTLGNVLPPPKATRSATGNAACVPPWGTRWLPPRNGSETFWTSSRTNSRGDAMATVI